MFNRIIPAIVVLAISVVAGAAKDEPRKEAKKEECPTLDMQEVEGLLRQAPSCQRARVLFEICQSGSSGDVGLGAVVIGKCEGDFLKRLGQAQKRAYDRQQKKCLSKYENEQGTMYRSFEAFCGADLASKYSGRFLKADHAGVK
jgi:hypothetical protein